jgi:hypothetical protein
MDKIQITTKKDDARMQRFDLCLNDTTELLTREPLDSAATNLTLHIPLEIGDDDLDRNNMEHLS